MTINRPIYNEEFKEAYLERFVDTQEKRNQYMSAFRKIYFSEKRLNKDLFDMTLSELHETLKGAKFKSANSAKNNISVINEYILTCSEEGFSSLRNTDRTISVSNDTVMEYVYNNLNTLFTMSELIDALRRIDVELYYLIGMLHLHGIGSRHIREIQELKVEDLREENGKYIVYITSRKYDNNEVSIPKDLYEQLLSYNDVLHDSKLGIKFLEVDTIFKPYDNKAGRTNLQINRSVWNTLWKEVSEILNEDVDSRTFKRSACSYYAYQYMIESGEMLLTREILRKVANRFGIAKNTSGYFYDKALHEIFIDFIQEEYGDFEIADDLKDKVVK